MITAPLALPPPPPPRSDVNSSFPWTLSNFTFIGHRDTTLDPSASQTLTFYPCRLPLPYHPHSWAPSYSLTVSTLTPHLPNRYFQHHPCPLTDFLTHSLQPHAYYHLISISLALLLVLTSALTLTISLTATPTPTPTATPTPTPRPPCPALDPTQAPIPVLYTQVARLEEQGMLVEASSLMARALASSTAAAPLDDPQMDRQSVHAPTTSLIAAREDS